MNILDVIDSLGTVAEQFLNQMWMQIEQKVNQIFNGGGKRICSQQFKNS